MKDKGLVLSTNKDLAKVEVRCLAVCHDCSARALCIGRSASKGLLSVKNPVSASPGDQVALEVPEEKYSKSLIVLFGGLLAATLLGLAAGYFISILTGLPAEPAGITGLLIGIIAGIGILTKYFHNENKRNLYPSITEIIRKGDRHG